MQAADKFPDVNGYCNRWPVTDLIKMRLKNTSSKHRKLLEKMTAGKFSKHDMMGVKHKSKRVARTKPKVLILIYIDPPLTTCTRQPRSSNIIQYGQ